VDQPPLPAPAPSPTHVRLQLAQRLVERTRQELGAQLLAAACYGSVAYGTAGPYSDLELAFITTEPLAARSGHSLEEGILVVWDYLPAAPLLAGAGTVTLFWGIEADANRRFLPLWDPTGYFPRLRTAAVFPPAAFARALRDSWWLAFEIRGKVLNALLEGDRPRALYHGWEFARTSALRLALYERVPYSVPHRLWREAAARGYGMAPLLGVLAAGAAEQVEAALEAVWAATRAWGAPDSRM
jgi:kanamycin nucleotidyltransferase